MNDFLDDDEADERELEAHEYRIRRCRVGECRKKIIWFVSAGRNIAVDADSVEPSDRAYDAAKHILHNDSCPGAARFLAGK